MPAYIGHVGTLPATNNSPALRVALVCLEIATQHLCVPKMLSKIGEYLQGSAKESLCFFKPRL